MMHVAVEMSEQFFRFHLSLMDRRFPIMWNWFQVVELFSFIWKITTGKIYSILFCVVYLMQVNHY